MDALVPSIALLFVALLLGMKHSLDADHVVAISSILARSPSVKKTTGLSLSWALGHMITASIITFLLFTFKEIFLTQLLDNFELLVALMLIFIAVLTLGWEFDIIKFGKHKHGHVHADGSVHPPHETTAESTPIVKEHTHRHFYVIDFKGDYSVMSAIGIIHGLASNDELLLFFTLTLGFTEFLPILVGVFIFTIGVIIGMVGYGVLLNYPILKYGQERVARTVNISIAILSLAYAFYIILGGQTINLLPFIPEL